LPVAYLIGRNIDIIIAVTIFSFPFFEVTSSSSDLSCFNHVVLMTFLDVIIIHSAI